MRVGQVTIIGPEVGCNDRYSPTMAQARIGSNSGCEKDLAKTMSETEVFIYTEKHKATQTKLTEYKLVTRV